MGSGGLTSSSLALVEKSLRPRSDIVVWFGLRVFGFLKKSRDLVFCSVCEDVIVR